MRLGADPEVFLQDVNGKPISSIGYINADKWHPLQIPDMEKGFTLQEDNVSLEYGIPPAANADELVHHIQAVMDKSKDWLPGLSFSGLSCLIFPEDQMMHPAAHVFGCEPDFNAWTKEVNNPPQPPHPLMRSAGGHVHVETQKTPEEVVKLADLYLGVPAAFMDAAGAQRRGLYGKPGAFRPKPYGVEYRVLSNFWIFSEDYIRWVWRNMARAEEAAENLDVSGLSEKIIAAVQGDLKQAKRLVKTFDLEVL